MQLLVSVRTAADARVALAGGADVIDAKEPSAGALGPVSLDVLDAIVAAVHGGRMVTAALGDAADEASVEDAARRFAAGGAALVKVGFAQVASAARVEALIAAAVRGARAGSASAGVVAVGYADHRPASSIAPGALVDAAISAGATGVLLDTVDKTGPGLCHLMSREALTAWLRRAHDAGLLAAVAGQLTRDDLSIVRDAGADIAGVRGAACDGGRDGHVSLERVRALAASCARPTEASAASEASVLP